ncbi:DUF6680 family protein [Sunxiuqinia rutila]|uniref:DUF6680 family protein n=1 Tax=Sunxiuqinia rutila TaxID=1397841 RepID=UPI003D36EE09
METIGMVTLIINTVILGINVWVISKSPTDAVKVGRELNETKQKDDAKRNLFFTLFSYRGSPVPQYFVDALNRIDVVFADTPTVLTAWHKYYDSLQQKDLVDPDKTWRLLRVDLLSEISKDLGYKDLKNYDFEKHYYPQGHEKQFLDQMEFHKEQFEYYKNSNQLTLKLLENLNQEDDNKE